MWAWVLFKWVFAAKKYNMSEMDGAWLNRETILLGQTDRRYQDALETMIDIIFGSNVLIFLKLCSLLCSLTEVMNLFLSVCICECWCKCMCEWMNVRMFALNYSTELELKRARPSSIWINRKDAIFWRCIMQQTLCFK